MSISKILLILLTFLSSCDYYKSQETILHIDLEQDFVCHQGDTVYLQEITSIRPIGDHFILVDGARYSFYILDSDFSIIDYYDFKERHYYFTDKIIDVAYRDGLYYILDMGWNIKVYNPQNGDISILELEQIHEFILGLTSIDFIDDTTFVVGKLIVRSPHASWERMVIPVGALYTTSGDIITDLSIPAELLQHQRGADFAYVTVYNNTIYYCFSISPAILLFNKYGEILNHYILDYPGLIHPSDRDGQRVLTLFRDKLSIYDNYIFIFANRGVDDPVVIYKFDTELELLESYHIKDVLPGTVYQIIRLPDYFIIANSSIFDPNYLYKYRVPN